MPDNNALQVFYGTVPLILAIAAAFLRSQVLLKGILDRLGRVENGFAQVRQRLVALDTRAGIIYHP